MGVSSGTGYSLEVVPGDTVPRDIYSIMEYSYWHLVEVVYIYIYLCLYYHYRDIPLYPLYPPYPLALTTHSSTIPVTDGPLPLVQVPRGNTLTALVGSGTGVYQGVLRV